MEKLYSTGDKMMKNYTHTPRLHFSLLNGRPVRQILSVLGGLCLLAYSACSFSTVPEESKSQAEAAQTPSAYSGEEATAYLTVSATTPSFAFTAQTSGNTTTSLSRTLLPEAVDTTAFSNLSLAIKMSGTSSSITIPAANFTILNLALKSAPLIPAEYTFTLTASLSSAVWEGSVTQTVVSGANDITFPMTAQSGYGAFSLTLSYTGEATLATALLQDFSGSTLITSEDLTITGTSSGGTVTYAKTASEMEALTLSDTNYRVVIDFFGGENKDIPLNTYRELVRLDPGCASVAERTIDLNELYTITYYDVADDGTITEIDGTTVTFSGNAPSQYSRKSSITLPAAQKTDYTFASWYTDAACTAGNEITAINPGMTGNLSLYATWVPADYVVLKDNSTGTESKYYTLEDAVTAITNATGSITVTLYNGVTADDLGKSPKADTIAYAIRHTSADSIELVIDSAAAIAVTTCNNLFYMCEKMTAADLRGLITTGVTDMLAMFGYCTSLTSVNISGLDTSSVTTMSSMFSYCKALTTITGLDTIDTSSAAYMANMFEYCTSLTSLDLSNFTTTNVITMSAMFMNCTALTSLDISSFDTSSIQVIDSMFHNCKKLTALDTSRLTCGSATGLGYMFFDCEALTSLDLRNFDTSQVTVMQYLFYSCDKLKTIVVSDTFVTTNVTNQINMFPNDTALTGGMGTTFNSSYTDATYARIDGGTDSPGYFTDAYAVYVSSSGSDTTGDGSKDTPYASVSQAVSHINTQALSKGWTIIVNGTVSGATSINTLTAASLSICGMNSGTLDGNSVGTVLSVSVSVPFTLKYITLTGGVGMGGGGIFVGNGASVTLGNGVVISANESSYNSAAYLGGGVYIASAGSLTVTGTASITDNTGADGAGIYNAGTLIMTGGTVSSNSATRNGSGVYNGGVFMMSGDARVDSSDDVYLPTGKTIRIAGTLSGTTPVATITPSAYTAGTGVLSIDSASGTTMADEYTKFALSNSAWEINSSGLLQEAGASAGITITVPTYTNDDLELTASASGTNYVFTAKAGYSSYIWTIDSTSETTTSETWTMSASGLSVGTHTLLLIATDSSGNSHEATTTITISE